VAHQTTVSDEAKASNGGDNGHQEGAKMVKWAGLNRKHEADNAKDELCQMVAGFGKDPLQTGTSRKESLVGPMLWRDSMVQTWGRTLCNTSKIRYDESDWWVTSQKPHKKHKDLTNTIAMVMDPSTPPRRGFDESMRREGRAAFR
jgi:hypothetical protein